jgi:hypothetical protein
VPEPQELLTWLGIPSGIIGIGLPLLLWLRGTIMLTSDHTRQVAALEAAHATALAECRRAADAELTAAQSAAEVQRTAEAATMRALQERLDHVVADRDAWRDAQQEEAAARAASERAAAALMEQGQVSLALLGALKDALGHRPAGG